MTKNSKISGKYIFITGVVLSGMLLAASLRAGDNPEGDDERGKQQKNSVTSIKQQSGGSDVAFRDVNFSSDSGDKKGNKKNKNKNKGGGSQ